MYLEAFNETLFLEQRFCSCNKQTC